MFATASDAGPARTTPRLAGHLFRRPATPRFCATPSGSALDRASPSPCVDRFGE